MRDFDDFLRDLRAEDPTFEEGFEAAKAELELGMVIARLRESRGLSQRALAERAGMPQSAVARYEKAGRTPSVTILWRLAEALDATFVLGPSHAVQSLDYFPPTADRRLIPVGKSEVHTETAPPLAGLIQRRGRLNRATTFSSMTGGKPSQVGATIHELQTVA